MLQGLVSVAEQIEPQNLASTALRVARGLAQEAVAIADNRSADALDQSPASPFDLLTQMDRYWVAVAHSTEDDLSPPFPISLSSASFAPSIVLGAPFDLCRTVIIQVDVPVIYSANTTGFNKQRFAHTDASPAALGKSALLLGRIMKALLLTPLLTPLLALSPQDLASTVAPTSSSSLLESTRALEQRLATLRTIDQSIALPLRSALWRLPFLHTLFLPHPLPTVVRRKRLVGTSTPERTYTHEQRDWAGWMQLLLDGDDTLREAGWRADVEATLEEFTQCWTQLNSYRAIAEEDRPAMDTPSDLIARWRSEKGSRRSLWWWDAGGRGGSFLLGESEVQDEPFVGDDAMAPLGVAGQTSQVDITVSGELLFSSLEHN